MKNLPSNFVKGLNIRIYHLVKYICDVEKIGKDEVYLSGGIFCFVVGPSVPGVGECIHSLCQRRIQIVENPFLGFFERCRTRNS